MRGFCGENVAWGKAGKEGGPYSENDLIARTYGVNIPRQCSEGYRNGIH